MGNVTEVLRSVVYIVLTAIMPILLKYLIKLFDAKVDELSVKIKNERIKRYVNAVTDAIEIAVSSVSQTYVDALKENGDFDAESQEYAKNRAIEIAKKLITNDSRYIINMIYGDFDEYLSNAIEAYVRDSKLVVE